MIKDPAFWISIASLIVSIASALIAWRAQQLAKHTAALSPRTQVIDLLRQAASAIQKDHVVNPISIQRMKDARDRADLVFNDRVRSDLDRLIKTAERLAWGAKPGLLSLDFSDIEALAKDMESLISQMKADAALR